MARYRCNRIKCGRPPEGYTFEADEPVCPKCGATEPAVHELTDVHFVVMGSGPLMGPFGACHVACEPEREYLALQMGDGYAASDHPEAVTCPKCMGTRPFQEMVQALFPKLHKKLQAKKSNVTVDCGCPPK